MSKSMKFTIVQITAWSIVAISMVCIFTNEGTIEQWGDNRTKTILLALLFLGGYATSFILSILEKTKRWGFKRDERDKMIQMQAMSVGFIAALLYVFIVSISLYAAYESRGTMPVGWVWFIAYSTIVIANLSVTIPTLLLYRKQGF